MLQHLYGGKARQLDKMRRTKPGRYEHPINFERRIINSTYRGLERYDNKMTENSLRFFLPNDLIFFSYLVWLVGGLKSRIGQRCSEEKEQFDFIAIF